MNATITQDELNRIEEIRKTYPVYQRYFCCSRTITTRHSFNCPSSPDALGPKDNEDDKPVN